MRRVGSARACAGAARGAPRACRRSRPGAGARRRRARGGAGARGRARDSGRGVALPATSTAPGLRGAALGHAARVVARVALVLVGGVVLLVDDDQAEPRSARRPPSAARRTRAPPARSRAHSSWRSPAESFECRTATVSPKRATKRATICGVSAISGTSTITPPPSRERVRGGPQVDLGLARAGDAVQQQPLARRRRRRSRAAPRPARR